MFKDGEEVVCRINGERGYIVHSFKACVVKLDNGKAKVVPEIDLILKYVKKPVVDCNFRKGDRVILILSGEKKIAGVVFANRRFYIVHLDKTGELKVAFSDILAKAGTKIIPFKPGTILTPASGQKFGRNINVG